MEKYNGTGACPDSEAVQKEIDFFDSVAPRWDAMRQMHPERLDFLMELAGISPGARVLDVGSGTGVLLPWLETAVGASGHITAVDFSSGMLDKAKAKHSRFENIEYIAGDVMEIPLAKESIDCVSCLNVFPHFHRRQKDFLLRMYDILVPGGSLLIMHDISRAAVNGIHGSCGETREHRLPAAEDTALLLQDCGYTVLTAREDDTLYFVKGIRPGGKQGPP